MSQVNPASALSRFAACALVVFACLLACATAVMLPSKALADDASLLRTGEMAYVDSDVEDMTAAETAAANMPPVVRMSGDDRYGTMAAIVEEGYSGTSEWAVIATGSNFPDALAASALAGAKHCPVVLTTPAALAAEAQSQLVRLGVKQAYIIGGQAAVSESVEQEVAALGIETHRLEGSDRIATSLQVMREVKGLSDTVVIATGSGFADTLSIGPWAYASASPVVLTQSDGTLSQAALDAMKECGFTKYIIVGGTAVVSSSVETQLSDLTEVGRLAGDDRYATSKAVAEWEMGEGGLDMALPVVATGANFPDALAAASLCGERKSILLLASEGRPYALTALSNQKISEIGIAGGTSAVSEGVVYDMSAVLRGQTRDLSGYVGSYGFMNGASYVFIDVDNAGYGSIHLRMGTYNTISTTMDITNWFSAEVVGNVLQYNQVGTIRMGAFRGSVTLGDNALLLTPQEGLPKTLTKRSNVPEWTAVL